MTEEPPSSVQPMTRSPSARPAATGKNWSLTVDVMLTRNSSPIGSPAASKRCAKMSDSSPGGPDCQEIRKPPSIIAVTLGLPCAPIVVLLTTKGAFTSFPSLSKILATTPTELPSPAEPSSFQATTKPPPFRPAILGLNCKPLAVGLMVMSETPAPTSVPLASKTSPRIPKPSPSSSVRQMTAQPPLLRAAISGVAWSLSPGTTLMSLILTPGPLKVSVPVS